LALTFGRLCGQPYEPSIYYCASTMAAGASSRRSSLPWPIGWSTPSALPSTVSRKRPTAELQPRMVATVGAFLLPEKVHDEYIRHKGHTQNDGFLRARSGIWEIVCIATSAVAAINAVTRGNGFLMKCNSRAAYLITMCHPSLQAELTIRARSQQQTPCKLTNISNTATYKYIDVVLEERANARLGYSQDDRPATKVHLPLYEGSSLPLQNTRTARPNEGIIALADLRGFATEKVMAKPALGDNLSLTFPVPTKDSPKNITWITEVGLRASEDKFARHLVKSGVQLADGVLLSAGCYS